MNNGVCLKLFTLELLWISSGGKCGLSSGLSLLSNAMKDGISSKYI